MTILFLSQRVTGNLQDIGTGSASALSKYDSDKVYGIPYGSRDIRLKVTDNKLIVVGVITTEELKYGYK